MTEPALSLLMERLLWPVPRVRWEVARSLATLIREKHREAPKALVDWISTRQLESEVVLGLDIIEAFDLGRFFCFRELNEAIGAPSHLSDSLLKANFSDASGLYPFRYEVSPGESAPLGEEVDAWFHQYRRWSVAPILSMEFEKMGQSTGFPFIQHWNHEWRWLQFQYPRPSAEYPLYFSGGDRQLKGQFDQGQRELYLSAYLRTLAYASLSGVISDEVAEQLALLTMPMNRGFADLSPIKRPPWARDLRARASMNTQQLAQDLLDQASASCRPGHTPVALRAIETSETGFIELDISMAVGPHGQMEEIDGVAEAPLHFLVEHPGRVSGAICPKSLNPSRIGSPTLATQAVVPEIIGRCHLEFPLQVRLASPDVFATSGNICCDEFEIRLDTATEIFSTWTHWYTDWQPVTFPELGSTLSSVTTVSESSLNKLRLVVGQQIRHLARVKTLVRPEPFRDSNLEEQVFWL